MILVPGWWRPCGAGATTSARSMRRQWTPPRMQGSSGKGPDGLFLVYILLINILFDYYFIFRRTRSSGKGPDGWV